MPRRGSPYGPVYQRQRALLLHGEPLCAHGCGRVATEADHQPPLTLHDHVNGSGCCRLVPACFECQRAQAVQLQRRAPMPVVEAVPVADVMEPLTAGPLDAVWDVPWLDGLRDVPEDSVWPRLMTVPHPLAVGSLGVEFVRDAELRSGRSLWWWQRLMSARMLEVDADGVLLWEEVLLSVARQSGKSWWLRELFLWRIRQGVRFGEPQDVIHTGKDLGICREVQRAARAWAKARPDDYKVREVNGQEEIELLEDGSRWMVRAKEAVYGYSVSLAGVDEAWKVPASSIDEGLTPTMIEREQSQLLLVSTAHRLATVLMVGRRKSALVTLCDPPAAGGILLVEWSAAPDAPTDDPLTWRMASPHWSDRREQHVRAKFNAAVSGESDDPDEPDPMESFRAQWLNIWPERASRRGVGDELVSIDDWAELSGSGTAVGPLTVAVEDNYGQGAAVAAVSRLRDGRFEVDGWLCDSWEVALADAQALVSTRPRSQLILGASLMAKAPRCRPVPVRAGTSETRSGLSLLRDLVASRQVLHDSTPDLDVQVGEVRVKEMASGLLIVPGPRTDLLRAAVWALMSAQQRRRVPTIR